MTAAVTEQLNSSATCRLLPDWAHEHCSIAAAAVLFHSQDLHIDRSMQLGAHHQAGPHHASSGQAARAHLREHLQQIALQWAALLTNAAA